MQSGCLELERAKQIIIFPRICNRQEKLFIQWGRFSFFFQSKIANFFMQK